MADATKDLTPAQEIAALKKQLADQAKTHGDELRSVKDESSAKDAIVEAQAKQLAAAKAQGAGQLSVVTHEDKHYQVLAGQFSLDGKVITHDQLAESPELVKQVVEQYPGLVQLLEEKAE